MSSDAGGSKPPAERYVHDHEGVFTKRVMGARTATHHAAFLMPHLRPGLKLLDIGSGPGTITVGLAETVAPGEVIGIDMEESQVAAASQYAVAHSVSNVRFAIGDAYQLAFEDNTFDAVYSNAVLEHMTRPVAVLREALRVMKPKGVVGVRSPDFGGLVFAPTEAVMERHLELYYRYRQHRGGDPFIGRKLRALLREAGLEKIESSASCDTHAATVLQAMLEGIISEFVLRMREEAIRLGWADASHFERVEDAFRAWGSSPDAFAATVFCEAIGWKS